MTTFRSDEEYWAWAEKRARLAERLRKAARYAALMAALALLLFAFMYFCVRHMGETRQSQWSQSLEAYLSKEG